MVNPYKDIVMTVITSNSELVEKFLIGKEKVFEAVIKVCGVEKFVYRANLIYQGIASNEEDDKESEILRINGCSKLLEESDRVDFYQKNHGLFMDYLKSMAHGDKGNEGVLSVMSLVLYGTEREKIKAVFIDNERIADYAKLVSQLVNYVRIKICIDFTRFADKYKQEHDFFDIDFGLDANLTIAAKRLLLKGFPSFYITDDGIVRHSCGQAVKESSSSLADVLNIIQKSGYQDGKLSEYDDIEIN